MTLNDMVQQQMWVADDQFIPLSKPLLQLSDFPNAPQLSLADDADPVAEVLYFVHHVGGQKYSRLVLASLVIEGVRSRMSQIWRR